MTLLKKAKPEMAFLKMGIYGEAGSGKSFTSSQVAIGIHGFIKSKKPVAFIDTETGSDFMIPIFEKKKIEFLVAKTRAFKDLLEIMDDAEKSCAVLIIDSITHIWNEMTECYCEQHKISRITLPHWQPVKRTWREFTDRFCNSSLHVIMAGRSADKWEDVVGDDNTKELKKVGTKMRAETQIGYEPSLLVEMEQVHKSPKIGSGWVHRAWVIKDRWNEQTQMEGKNFDNPTFDSFSPHIKLLNLGGKHRALDQNRTSEEMFENNTTGEAKYRKAKILIEKIENGLNRIYPGQTKEDKQGRIELKEKIFKTDSWTEITSMCIDELDVGLKKLREEYKRINGNEKKEENKK